LLVGDEPAILNLLEKLAPEYRDSFEIIDTGADLSLAATTSVKLIHEGRGDLILKGKTETALLLRAVLDKENGLRVSEVISDVLAYEHPDGLVLMSDGGINLAPELADKVAIIKNAVQVAHGMGEPNPKVALLSFIETVNPKAQSTVDAALISKMSERGQIPGCEIDGPLAFDLAIDPEAVRIKGIKSKVAGHADIVIVPNIEAGNLYGKIVSLYCGFRVAHFVVGTKVPILIPSRADTGENKMLCMAMALSCMKD
ncbi:MAG TPA: phosphate acyltransferase, partial [Candidatus Cloacimonadota bacterium]|nr:phosphate acyltransferase [Candidatus Cloacimonadota bacterium]